MMFLLGFVCGMVFTLVVVIALAALPGSAARRAVGRGPYPRKTMSPEIPRVSGRPTNINEPPSVVTQGRMVRRKPRRD